MKRFAIAGFALGLMATAAAAADMPVPYAKAPPPPEFSWTGLYVGGNAGWLQLEENGYPFCLDPTGAMQGPGCSIVQGGQMGSSGFFGGGQVGDGNSGEGGGFGFVGGEVAGHLLLESTFPDCLLSDPKGDVSAPAGRVFVVHGDFC